MRLLGLGNVLSNLKIWESMVMSHKDSFLLVYVSQLRLFQLQSQISKQESENLGKFHILPIATPPVIIIYANISYHLETCPINKATVKTHFGAG